MATVPLVPECFSGSAPTMDLLNVPRLRQGSQLSRTPVPNLPICLGFNEIERVFGRVVRAPSDGYPLYDIERIMAAGASVDVLRITLAVAGFARDQLEVLVEGGQLVIRGRQVEEKQRTYLYRGIAARQFQRVFLLAEGMEVMGAEFGSGLLRIDLHRPELRRPGRVVDIDMRD